MKALRKLILGETWTLPAGVAVALAVAGIARAANGTHGWWHDAGGFVLLAGVLIALSVSLPRRGGR
jgi:hypothetical protein